MNRDEAVAKLRELANELRMNGFTHAGILVATVATAVYLKNETELGVKTVDFVREWRIKLQKHLAGRN